MKKEAKKLGWKIADQTLHCLEENSIRTFCTYSSDSRANVSSQLSSASWSESSMAILYIFQNKKS
jgi:hypothetical protein